MSDPFIAIIVENYNLILHRKKLFDNTKERLKVYIKGVSIVDDFK